MTRELARALLIVAAGAVFGAGLALSGMTSPAKVLAFLDFGGDWDPSLLFVMAGAVGVHFVAYRLIARHPSPLLAERFELPTRRDLDARLVAGAAVFGAGWGLAGYCPGPGIVSLASGNAGAFVFVGGMLLGMLLVNRAEARAKAKSDISVGP